MDDLERLWPDPDRRDNALTRTLIRVHSQPEPRDTVTPAELRCLAAASAGLTAPETALIYSISVETVNRQLLTARRALRAKNTTHAVAHALRRGLIV